MKPRGPLDSSTGPSQPAFPCLAVNVSDFHNNVDLCFKFTSGVLGKVEENCRFLVRTTIPPLYCTLILASSVCIIHGSRRLRNRVS